jgi:hypothetical protein
MARLRRVLRIFALGLVIPAGLVAMLEVTTIALAWVAPKSDFFPIVVVMDVLIYLLMGLGFLLIPPMIVILLILSLGKLRRPGLPAPPHAG